MPSSTVPDPVADARRALIVRDLGVTVYDDVFRAMRAFTQARASTTPDELWLTEHAPVFTQGQAGKAEYVLAAGDIPVVRSDRGGQVTYHGPGQIVLYPLLDIRRLGLNTRQLVNLLEQTAITMLADLGLSAHSRSDAPGVYVSGAKIASLGLRIHKGRSYHGLSLNVDMDLQPFDRIDPCGMADLRVVQLKDFVKIEPAKAGYLLAKSMARALGRKPLVQKRALEGFRVSPQI